VGPSWRIDETYIKVKGHWVYLYRGVDKEGQTIDFFLSERRDIAAAKRFLQQAVEKHGVPQKITLDGYAASHEAVAALQKEEMRPVNLIVRTSRYLNNGIEQDHRRVKQRVKPMLGFKRFAHAAITITGSELIHKIKKGQVDVSAMCPPRTQTPQVWEVVLAACMVRSATLSLTFDPQFAPKPQIGSLVVSSRG
jgi:transposase-like protein